MMNRPPETTSSTWGGEFEAPSGKKGKSAPRPGHTGIQFHRLDGIIPAVSARILKASSEEPEEAIHSSLQAILQSLGLERGGRLKVGEDLHKVTVSHVWYDHGVRTVSSEINLAQALPWTYRQVVVLGTIFPAPGAEARVIDVLDSMRGLVVPPTPIAGDVCSRRRRR